ncbi:hypothetical protein BO71DRAFT_467833 [Aspergillus ellipticus CBS 707.79]|uniref:chitinase n=1 Tax=Aspergillus ellipticus CBS 707.79 TaxID=1448320 RepID=A0A319CTJ3_9EURO|nr:hypothetical protein BO71DRAFT_467833 [Aspergillus ellipticus CBS 707.79]
MSFVSNSSAWLRPRNPFLTFLSIALFTFSFAVRPSLAINVPIRLPVSPEYRGRSSLLYSFSFYDPVDDLDTLHRIFTCTSFGPDWTNLPVNTSNLAAQSEGALAPVSATYQIGSWPSSEGVLVSYSLTTLKQFRQYLSNGLGPVNRPTILFTSYGLTSVGLYIGQGLQDQGVGDTALACLETSLATSSNIDLGASMAMQFCQPGQTSHHVFGFFATGNGTFAAIQEALASWSKAECLDFLSYDSYNTASCGRRRRALAPQTTCSTVEVVAGDGCASLAKQCGITVAQFTEYNPASDECSTLAAGDHVCCSAGTLPDYAPKPQADSTCATYTVQANDKCSTIAAAHSFTIADIEKFNADTWGWGACSPLYTQNIICLSTGNPPMPAAVANACPLNACCDAWGECGTTAQFYTNTNTGAPGTAKKGTNGCISNCGSSLVRSSPPSTYRSIEYYEGFNLQRSCLYQDISQLDVSAYTHIYFCFGVLSSSYVVEIPEVSTNFELDQFKQIQGAKRILSIGGWEFSTDRSTYMIFREGVTAANRLTMATNIATFIKAHDLDGVNIDWEYPGAPDIPGIPAASTDDGDNYLAFLAILRNLLGDKEITIAAPSSYWYLKGFPIKKMAPLLDYIIYMTYDLHGQWDSNSQWSQLGCPTGNCLRSDVNITETIGAFVMITKAGVHSNQVVVGVTSYGRSFAMAEAGCYGPECRFLGSADDSQAAPGPCTQSPGYIANAEIEEILANSSRVTKSYIDLASDSNILATDLQTFNPVPYPAKSWGRFIDDVVLDKDPYVEGNRTGNWTSLTCSDPAVQDALYMPCAQRWVQLDASNAWSDAINIWTNIDESHLEGDNPEEKFSWSIMNTLRVSEETNCGLVSPQGGCDQALTCASLQGFGSDGGSGPAAMVIYESLTNINKMYSQFFDAINDAAGTYIDDQLPDFETTFAPVPPAPSNDWEVILTNLLGLGITAVAAPYFDGVFASLPAVRSILGDSGADTAKDITNAAIAFGAAIASAELPGKTPGKWTEEKQKTFTDTLGLCSMDPIPSIALLTKLMTNGNLIEGSGGAPGIGNTTTTGTTSQIESSINKAFFGFAIPSVWAVSGTSAFVVDSGYPCSAQNPLTDYMTAATQEATYSSYNDKLYYLDHPDGAWKGCTVTEKELAQRTDCPECGTSTCVEDATYFTAPPGLSSLGGGSWGYITLPELIEASVRTYVANGNANGNANGGPVAWASWSNPSQSNSSAPNYPCNPLQGDETSSASPKGSDCQTIVKNIQGTNGEWTTGISHQHDIAKFGSCYFGVQNVGVAGDVTYHTGSQNIVNIINKAISEYASNGLVGAKGYMECGGDAGSQKVEWGLY